MRFRTVLNIILSGVFCIAHAALGITVAPVGAQQPPAGQSGASREIRPDDYVNGEVLSYIREGQSFTNRQQFDEAIAAYNSALQKAGKPLFSVYLALGAA